MRNTYMNTNEKKHNGNKDITGLGKILHRESVELQFTSLKSLAFGNGCPWQVGAIPMPRQPRSVTGDTEAAVDSPMFRGSSELSLTWKLCREIGILP